MKTKPLQVEILTACNLNPKYFMCVKLFIDFWNNTRVTEEIVFIPKVILIADDLPKSLKKYKDFIQVFNVKGVSDVFLSQVTRLYFPAYSKRDLVLTSDIDMFPLSSKAISKTITNVFLEKKFKNSSNAFIVFRDVLRVEQVPICYNISSPVTWNVIMNNVNLNELVATLKKKFLSISENYSESHGGEGWYFDQILLYKSLNSHRDIIKILPFTDQETGYKRLDRINWNPPFYWLTYIPILFNYFDDYHINHPVQKRMIWFKTILISKKINNWFFYLTKGRPVR